MLKIRCSCLPYLATPLVALAVLGFSGCSGGGNGEHGGPSKARPPTLPKSRRSKSRARAPKEIRRLIREQVKTKAINQPGEAPRQKRPNAVNRRLIDRFQSSPRRPRRLRSC